MKFIALTPIKHDGKRVEEGASIELNHQQAARLLASGSVAPFDGAKAKAEARAHADAEAKAKSAADAEAKAHADAEADAAAETAATTAAIPPADAS